MCRTITARSTVITSHSTPHAAAHPGRPARVNAAVPKIAQASLHRASHSRILSALRAVVGSLPVRIPITAPPCNVLFGTHVLHRSPDAAEKRSAEKPVQPPRRLLEQTPLPRTSEPTRMRNAPTQPARWTGMRRHMRQGYEGTGPGAITPDGCAVEFYSRLPVKDEPDIISAAVPPGAHLLELGSGVGRVTHALVERGFTVTAVDESAEML